MAEYDITRIPGIMRSKHWDMGAALMSRWFSLPANEHPDRGTPDTATITMAWTLRFDRAKRVYDEIVSERIWANPPAQRLLATKLREQGKLIGQEATFGGPWNDVVRADRDHIQHRTVGSMLDPADDMLAALGRFNFHVAVGGRVEPRGQRHTVHIDTVGIYVVDSYDFNGDQPLGYWSDNDFAGRFNPISGYAVSNASFRDWRARNHRGGDFMVYSDIRTLHRVPPDSFDV
jgi:hypothetical protein